MKKFNLEDRLVDFSVQIINVVEQTPKTRTGNHLAGQIVRSGTSSALNYGEAQSAESPRDFVHKMKVVLKELRETYVNLKIMHKGKVYENESLIIEVKKENDELISIFVKSVETAKRNMKD
tara:strand:+ start:10531 stop:10893 length:363 start_codon:yes stop_codon:yes gene_type:complete